MKYNVHTIIPNKKIVMTIVTIMIILKIIKIMITTEILQLHIVSVILSGREEGGRRRLTIVITIIAMVYKASIGGDIILYSVASEW